MNNIVGKIFTGFQSSRSSREISNNEMAGFEFLDHPADIGIKLWAPTLDSLFAQGHLALTSTLFELESISEVCTDTIEIESSDYEHLMYDWLSELVFLFDAEGKIYKQVEISKLKKIDNQVKVTAIAKGEIYDQLRHQVKTYVKAITMHQLSIVESKNCFEATVYLDI